MSTTLNRIKTLLPIAFTLAALVIFMTPEKGEARAFSCCAHSFETYHFLEEIDNHILSLRDKNIPQAYFKHTSREFRKKTSYPEFERIVKKYPCLSDNLSITLRSIKFQEGVGRYSGTLTAKTGEELLVEYDLFKEGDAWKILGFTLLKNDEKKTTG